MLQQSEIKHRFDSIERNIEDAVSSCKSDTKLPQKLKDCVTQWQQHAEKAKPILEAHNNKEVIACVNDLEKIGARAELALRDVIDDDNMIKDFVTHAHRELAELKKKLH